MLERKGEMISERERERRKKEERVFFWVKFYDHKFIKLFIIVLKFYVIIYYSFFKQKKCNFILSLKN